MRRKRSLSPTKRKEKRSISPSKRGKNKKGDIKYESIKIIKTDSEKKSSSIIYWLLSILKYTILSVFTIILIAILILLFFHRGLIIKYDIAVNEVCDIKYEDISFDSKYFGSSNITIKGMFVPASKNKIESSSFGKYAYNRDHYPQFDLNNNKGVVIVVHGHGANSLRHLNGDLSVFTKAVCPLHSAGFHVLSIDLRNHGHSSYAPPVSFGLGEKNDVLGSIEYIKRKLGKDIPIFLWGESMGAATVLLAAHKNEKINDNVKAIVIDSSFANFDAAVTGWMKHKAKFLKSQDTMLKYLFSFASFFIPYMWMEADYFQPCDAISSLSVPIFLIHGQKDPIVSINEANKLLHCYKENLRYKNGVQIETLFHDGIHVAGYKDKTYFNRITNFFVKYL